MYMYIYMYMYMYICAHVYIHLDLYTYTNTYTHAQKHAIRINVCAPVCISVRVWICLRCRDFIQQVFWTNPDRQHLKLAVDCVVWAMCAHDYVIICLAPCTSRSCSPLPGCSLRLCPYGDRGLKASSLAAEAVESLSPASAQAAAAHGVSSMLCSARGCI